jgi:sporulation protein YlmC with PRC-barrel domain
MQRPKNMPAKSIIGRHVVNDWGIELGRIEDLAVDTERGRIAYVVLSYRGIGADEKFFAIPWDTLTFHAESQEFILDIPRDDLEGAPGFAKNRWPEAADPNWTTQVYAAGRAADQGRS